jgi:hypothetical protein
MADQEAEERLQAFVTGASNVRDLVFANTEPSA